MGLARARKEVHSSGTYWGLKGHPGGRYFEGLEEEPPGGSIPKLQTKSFGRAETPPFIPLSGNERGDSQGARSQTHRFPSVFC